MEPSGISDPLATVKSREVQRALLAEMAGDRSAASRHFLAAGHLELVLAEDYVAAGADDLALRSSLGAASCFWRADQILQAQGIFDALLKAYPSKTAAIQQVIAELNQDHSAQAS